MQSTLLLVAPALFAATIYMFLARIIRAVDGESLSPLRTKILTPLFVTGDVLSFFIQAGGAGIMVKGSGNSMKMGQNIILGGFFLQIMLFCVFLVVGAVFAGRMSKMQKSYSGRSAANSLPWLAMLRMLFGVSGLILLRNVFRVIEYIMGQDGYLLAHEWSLYLFDALPMLGVMVVFLSWYPTQLYVMSGPDVEMASADVVAPLHTGRSEKVARGDTSSVKS